MIHVAGKVDPLDDIDVINLELAFADLAVIEKRLERLKKGEAVVVIAAAAGRVGRWVQGEGGSGD